jgi:antitoxin ParD1/3/4
MDESRISIAVSDIARDFIESPIAAGEYADEQDVLHAGFAAPEREAKLRFLRSSIAEADAEFERGEYKTFNESDDLTQYIIDNAENLR